jgi:hypothetical protein
MLIHGSLKEEEILAYADLEPAKYIYYTEDDYQNERGNQRALAMGI